MDVGSVKEIVSVRLRNVKLARGDDSELDHPQGFRYTSGSFTDAHQLGIEVKLLVKPMLNVQMRVGVKY